MELGGLKVNGGQLLIRYFDSSGIMPCVNLGFDLEPLSRCRIADQLDDHIMANQGTAAPILSDVAKHPMFNLVPFFFVSTDITG